MPDLWDEEWLPRWESMTMGTSRTDEDTVGWGV